jgi:hypothetical protein
MFVCGGGGATLPATSSARHIMRPVQNCANVRYSGKYCRSADDDTCRSLSRPSSAFLGAAPHILKYAPVLLSSAPSYDALSPFHSVPFLFLLAADSDLHKIVTYFLLHPVPFCSVLPLHSSTLLAGNSCSTSVLPAFHFILRRHSAFSPFCPIHPHHCLQTIAC